MHTVTKIIGDYPQTSTCSAFRSHPGLDVFAEMPAEFLALADPTGIVSCQVTGSTLIFQGREPSDGMHTAH
jgi:hypothetical protein